MIVRRSNLSTNTEFSLMLLAESITCDMLHQRLKAVNCRGQQSKIEYVICGHKTRKEEKMMKSSF